MEKAKLTHYEKKLIAKIGSGHLCCEVDHTQAGIDAGGYRYWIEPSGKNAGASSAKGLIAKGMLEPLPTRLFGGVVAQQYRIANMSA